MRAALLQFDPTSHNVYSNQDVSMLTVGLTQHTALLMLSTGRPQDGTTNTATATSSRAAAASAEASAAEQKAVSAAAATDSKVEEKQQQKETQYYYTGEGENMEHVSTLTSYAAECSHTCHYHGCHCHQQGVTYTCCKNINSMAERELRCHTLSYSAPHPPSAEGCQHQLKTAGKEPYVIESDTARRLRELNDSLCSFYAARDRG